MTSPMIVRSGGDAGALHDDPVRGLEDVVVLDEVVVAGQDEDADEL